MASFLFDSAGLETPLDVKLIKLRPIVIYHYEFVAVRAGSKKLEVVLSVGKSANF
jgi:hypothetical protein